MNLSTKIFLLCVMYVTAKSQWKADTDDDSFPFVDYDEYDAQVFKLPSRTTNRFVAI